MWFHGQPLIHASLQVDHNVGLLMSELERAGLWGHINVVITSDHGMAQCSPDRLIRLDDCLPPDKYTALELSPVASIIPLAGIRMTSDFQSRAVLIQLTGAVFNKFCLWSAADPEAVYSLLKKCHPHMEAYLKKDIPKRLHYRNNERIQPILLIADEGWTIVQRGNKISKRK